MLSKNERDMTPHVPNGNYAQCPLDITRKFRFRFTLLSSRIVVTLLSLASFQKYSVLCSLILFQFLFSVRQIPLPTSLQKTNENHDRELSKMAKQNKMK